MKRKKPSESFSVSQTSKQLKTEIGEVKSRPSDEVIQNSSIWLNAALLAKDGNHEPLAELDAKEKDLSKIDWNMAVSTGPYRGVTLAFLATELRLDNKPTLMHILLSSPAANLQQLNWDAGPQDEKHKHFGITLAWMGVYFDRKKMAGGLIRLLCEQPESALKKLNWNAYPKNRFPVPDISLVWMVASNYYHGEATTKKLAEILMNSSEELGDFNWNSCPPPDQEDLYRNMNLAWFAAASYPSERDNEFFKKLTQSPMQVLERINWNSKPDLPWDSETDFEDETDYTLAFFAFRNLNVSASSYLLDTLVTLPIHVFKKIDWNAGPVEDQTAYHGGISLAWGAAYLALEYEDDRLLEKLSESGPSNLLWDVAPNCESRPESLLNDGIFKYFGVNLIWMGVKLATGEPANTALLELFLNSPAQTLKAMNWNKLLEDDNNEDNQEESKMESTSGAELSPVSTPFIQKHPSKLITAYQNIPKSSPVFAKAQFALASWYLSRNELNPEELKCSIITNLEHENPHQVKIANAFYHACHWFHYQTEEKSESKHSFINSIIKEIFSSNGFMIKELPTDIQSKTETFLASLVECDDPEILPLLIEHFRGMLQTRRLEREAQELSSLTPPSLPSLKK
jgi:hypothetical protein